MKDNRWSFRTLVVLCATGAILGISHYVQRGQPLITVWDVYGYYMYLPGGITYGDVSGWEFVEEHFAEYPMQSGIYQRLETESGSIPVYTAGLSYLWLPGYLVADVVAGASPYPRDGLSAPYQWALLMTALLCAALGLIFLRKLLLRYFDDRVTAIALGLIVLGTNYLHYGFLDPGMPHGYLFALHAVYLFVLDSWFRNDKSRYMLLAGAILALMCLVRPTEIVAALLPAGYVIIHRNRLVLRRWHFRQLAVTGVTMLLLILPQIILWKMNTGDWIFNAYSESGHVFHFDGRHLLDGLLSYRKGWLIYTPMAILAIVGWVLAKNTLNRWKWPVLLLVGAHMYLTFSWHIWWYANSFGSRPMVHIYPELTLGLAALTSVAWSRKVWRSVLMGVYALLTTLNLFQTWQFNRGLLPGDGITKDYFRLAFGRTELSRDNLQYLQYSRLKEKVAFERESIADMTITPEDLQDQMFTMKDDRPAQVLTPDIEYSRTLSVPLDEALAENLKGQWIDREVQVYLQGNAFNSTDMARLVFECKRGGENIFWHAVEFQVFIPTGTWYALESELRLPAGLQTGDVLRLYIWNQSPDTIYLHRLGLSLLR